MDIITALRHSTGPKHIDLSGYSTTKKIAIAIFALLALATVVVIVRRYVGWTVPVVDYSGLIAQAVRENKPDSLEMLLLNKGAHLNVMDRGRTLLAIAYANFKAGEKEIKIEADCTRCHNAFKIITILAQDPSCNVNEIFYDRVAFLHFAAEYDEELLEDLLEREDINLEVTDGEGNTALFIAAENGRESVLLKLCKAGANVNTKGYNGKSALTQALKKGHHACVEELLKYKPKTTLQDQEMIAKRGCFQNNPKESQFFQFEVLRRFIEKRTYAQAYKALENVLPNLTIFEDYKRNTEQNVDTIIDEFVDGYLSSEDEEENTSLTCSQIVMNNEVSQIKNFDRKQLNQKDANGKYPIQYAYTKEAIDELVKAGAVVQIDCDSEDTLLHEAVYENNPDKIAALKDKIDVNQKNASEETPLILAAKCKKIKALKALLEMQEVKVDEQDLFGNTAYHYVAAFNLQEVLPLLTKRQAKIDICNDERLTPVSFAMKHGKQEMVLKLLENAPDDPQYLFMAANLGWKEVINTLLLSLSCKIQEKSTGYTLLHYAIEKADIDMIKRLISMGIEIDAQDHEGRTPLHLSIQFGQPEIMKILLMYGAKTNTPDDRGWTPFFYASYYGAKGGKWRDCLNDLMHNQKKYGVDLNYAFYREGHRIDFSYAAQLGGRHFRQNRS